MNIIRKFKKNENGRDFVVGDIHGCYDMFMEELEKIQFNKETDRIFSVGDLVDRGKKNVESLKLVLEPWFFSVIGNHEDMLFEPMLHGSLREVCDYLDGYGEWIERESTVEEVREICKQVLPHFSMVMIVDTKDGLIGISHASPPRGFNWLDEEHVETNYTRIIWDREDFFSAKKDHPLNYPTDKITHSYHGHTPHDTVITTRSSTWLDTGAVFKGKLTLIRIQ